MSKLTAALAGSLAALVAATNVQPGYQFATEADMKELVAAGFAEGPNKAIVDPANKKAFAYRATAAGVAALAEGEAGSGAAAPKSEFKIVKGLAMPTVTRGADKSGKYPFDQLGHDEAGNGDSFFIPAADKTSPSKSYGSVVSQANKRYLLKGDFRHFTTRTMNGDQWGHAGVKGVAVFRDSKTEEARLKADPAIAATLK